METRRERGEGDRKQGKTDGERGLKRMLTRWEMEGWQEWEGRKRREWLRS